MLHTSLLCISCFLSFFNVRSFIVSLYLISVSLLLFFRYYVILPFLFCFFFCLNLLLILSFLFLSFPFCFFPHLLYRSFLLPFPLHHISFPSNEYKVYQFIIHTNKCTTCSAFVGLDNKLYKMQVHAFK